jgi:hypothetical protein
LSSLTDESKIFNKSDLKLELAKVILIFPFPGGTSPMKKVPTRQNAWITAQSHSFDRRLNSSWLDFEMTCAYTITTFFGCRWTYNLRWILE